MNKSPQIEPVLWIPIGLALGAGIGVIFDNIALGTAIGVVAGAALMAIMSSARKR